MAEESFILVSLKDKKSKMLAQVISSDTARKILEYLSAGEASESKIAKDLSLPISTVHYNLKHLLDAKLVLVEEFHYSKKGREVDHYKLANKFVIIAPQESTMETIKDKLKDILPVALICAAGAGLIQILSRYIARPLAMGGQMLSENAAPILARGMAEADKAVPAMKSVADVAVQTAVPETIALTTDGAGTFAQNIAGNESMHVLENAARPVMDFAHETVAPVIHSTPVNAALWFLIGSMSAILIYIIIISIKARLSKK
ncbi:hypothetical protein COV93_07345 [Candidatus Woesearchaeota archaeon CG11_big_fil_rev_8_21_14_0_20_43_8]|nr:MAG: hypothetical protein COV93_07345 [Candidatus Woesearchaeota archaeon CG11_big_fil_rev_8_21_14_0_20_43_8]PIO08832.1 MAG: hypothetical protein COT47_01000 [Candidatus Woesearchaeota archaeon CG08_land_8_20_14_0_20_43_7]